MSAPRHTVGARQTPIAERSARDGGARNPSCHAEARRRRMRAAPANPHDRATPSGRGADILVCGCWRLSSRQFLRTENRVEDRTAQHGTRKPRLPAGSKAGTTPPRLARKIVAPRTTPRKTPMNRAKSSLIQVNRTTARKDGFSPVLFADVAWPAREGFRSSRLNIWVLFPPIRENSRHSRQSSPFGFRPSNLTRVGQPMSYPSCENRAMNDDLITLGGGGSHFF